MFGLFHRTKSKRSRPIRARLEIESLEGRVCPSLTIVGFAAAATNVDHQAQLSGTVTGGPVANDWVTFSGVVSGETTTDAAGHFSFVGTASGLGTVNAVAETQDLTQFSDMVSASLTVAAPTISFRVTYGPAKSVTFTGTVADGQPGGLTVNFSGVVAGSVVTNSDGSFTFSTTADQLAVVSAITTNIWGVQSDPAQLTLASNPQITNFTATESFGNTWTFTGTVLDAYAPGLTVNFGGLTSLTNQSATVGSDGTFSLTVQLLQGESGTATAQFTDWWGLVSNQATTYVRPT